jgi:hypothetical protein
VSVTQVVKVESGFAYGVIGADLHVFEDRGPVYVLTCHQPAAPPDPAWLPERHSQLLDARLCRSTDETLSLPN